MSLAVLVDYSGGIHLEPAIVEARQFQFAAVHGGFLAQPFYHLRQQLESKGFQYRFSTDIPSESKKPLERRVDQLDAFIFIENQHSFGHAVEQGLFAGGPFRLLAMLFFPETAETTAPCQMDDRQSNQGQEADQVRHGSGFLTESVVLSTAPPDGDS